MGNGLGLKFKNAEIKATRQNITEITQENEMIRSMVLSFCSFLPSHQDRTALIPVLAVTKDNPTYTMKHLIDLNNFQLESFSHNTLIKINERSPSRNLWFRKLPGSSKMVNQELQVFDFCLSELVV